MTLRKTLHVLLAAPVLFTAPPVSAEESPLVVSIVTGIAPGDLLNIRATASAVGKVETRLANGASVKNLGCNDVNGYKWCKIAGIDNPGMIGWVPARYLEPTNPRAAPVTVSPAETAPPQAPVTIANGDGIGDAGGTPEKTESDVRTSGQDAAATTTATASRQPPAGPPPDLTARLGGADHPAGLEATTKSAAAIGKVAIEDAYRLAFAASQNPSADENPSTGEIQDPAGPVAQEPAEAAAPATGAAAPAAGTIPVPTPRPGLTDAAAIDTQIVARVEPPAAPLRAPDATGGIPCARYVGQPMTHCEASVARAGSGKADVTVTWPDGGTRVISFYAGMPAGSNSRSEFRFTREGNLSMIRVGVSERFEITDALALGD